MKKIPLPKGNFAIVDDDDYPYLSRFNWGCHNHHAARQMGTLESGNATIYMEFFIKQKKSNDRYLFKNGDSLDLRKSNLRISSWAVSAVHNEKTKKKTTSKYKGVYKEKISGKWIAYLTYRENGIRKKALYKCFNTESKAALARNKAAKELFGELAYQNKIT